jgi:hypothetical protein
MPRVSQQYRDARRRELLEAAGRCFAENGFLSTSMQDLFEASGLSAGLVYRYFRSKVKLQDATNPAAVESLDGRFRSHSILASLLFNLGAKPEPVAEPVAPPPPPPPPPPPATQTCPDGSVILATDACPVPPPPPPPPPVTPVRG